jgi:ribose transport system ATP-binding protein
MTLAASAAAPGDIPALVLRNLSKSFGGARALDSVSLEIAPGEVHGLLGQNGSGKSTLIKVLAGFHAPDAGGELSLYGRPVPLPMPSGEARRRGIAFVHQHLGLVPSLTVLENLRVGAFAAERRWLINWRREAQQARQVFARFGLAIDPDDRVGDLAPVEKALLAIIRAFEDLKAAETKTPGILILDEPTPFLPTAGVQQLFALVRQIVAEGASVIFVSHDVDEVMEITDRATVLRDGILAGTLTTRGATAEQFVEMIVGRRVQAFQTSYESFAARPVRATVSGLSGGTVADASFDIHEGEVLGLAGLVGSGFSDVPYLLYGAVPATSGKVSMAGTGFDLRGMAPPAALRLGLALIPADRLGSAAVGNLSIKDNMSLPVLGDFRPWSLDWSAIRRRMDELGSLYDVRPNDPDLNIGSLSGGNQQKVVMAKWLQTDPRLLLLDEPTQGVDVGARQQLFAALKQAALAGTSIICSSTDYEQLAQISDRVLIFARGRIVHELVGASITKDNIAEICLRGADAAPATMEHAS